MQILYCIIGMPQLSSHQALKDLIEKNITEHNNYKTTSKTG
jgi:hypothetical protein